MKDQFFYLATKYTLPRIYLCQLRRTHWISRRGHAPFLTRLERRAQPEKGIDYLYRENYLEAQEKVASAICTEEIEVDGELCHKLTDIIGPLDGLWGGVVEGLWSYCWGNIACLRRYLYHHAGDCSFPVGIGAYLVRFGERDIQVEGQSIILTGAPALNKILGREVYASSLQLGDTQIMYKKCFPFNC